LQKTITWAGSPDEGEESDIKMIKGTYVSEQFTWNTSVITVDGSSGEQWMPAVNVNPEGILSILYYSSGTSGSDPINIILKHSTDGGGFFITNNVGSSFTVTESNGFIGDYHGLASWFGHAYAPIKLLLLVGLIAIGVSN
jgi:hypothetical protein